MKPRYTRLGYTFVISGFDSERLTDDIWMSIESERVHYRPVVIHYVFKIHLVPTYKNFIVTQTELLSILLVFKG